MGISDKIFELLLSGVTTSPLLLALLWWGWSERNERQTIQHKYEQLVSRVEKGLSDSATALSEVSAGQQATVSMLDSMKNLLLVAVGRRGDHNP